MACVNAANCNAKSMPMQALMDASALLSKINAESEISNRLVTAERTCKSDDLVTSLTCATHMQIYL